MTVLLTLFPELHSFLSAVQPEYDPLMTALEPRSTSVTDRDTVVPIMIHTACELYLEVSEVIHLGEPRFVDRELVGRHHGTVLAGSCGLAARRILVGLKDVLTYRVREDSPDRRVWIVNSHLVEVSWCGAVEVVVEGATHGVPNRVRHVEPFARSRRVNCIQHSGIPAVRTPEEAEQLVSVDRGTSGIAAASVSCPVGIGPESDFSTDHAIGKGPTTRTARYGLLSLFWRGLNTRLPSGGSRPGSYQAGRTTMELPLLVSGSGHRQPRPCFPGPNSIVSYL